ncbi:bifunctional lysylphosphatidylglycerol flippase/synthetase MprF [Sphingobium sufflavum]|uniref:bifunctional lysylphosphatidylglycerol flippase/synthetase MprF n=1 Tax=Sphingobium sufflavum TaxID=1129547 RepID=UPI001F231CBD|nr:bifunctional lysylphosphatidylglycerol flippase/synthetase MprF [Sphingobium sufflavum]MCE7796435.1 bifunctional lysylphosphatidylglycerol flippase/synthetase MprF [Sphingobium sufflavum]
MSDLKTIVRHHRVAISMGLVCVLAALGFVALDRLLHAVPLHDIRAALTGLGPRHIFLAVTFTAMSYTALTFYDVLALRSIGQHLPYRTAALASFTSYTLSHNLGLSLLTGGSARYRVYSAAGLSVADVARVVTIAGFAFWGGVIILAGAALALHPQAMDMGGVGIGIGPGPLQGIGVLLLVAVAGLLLWLGPHGRLLKVRNWSIPLPGFGLALAQIGVAAIDLATASAALFILVPGVDPSLWPAFFIGYTLAIIAVLVTHVPGGIGVFEAVILATLPSSNRPELIAALLVYRLIYYIAPLLLSVAIMAFQEGRRWRTPLAHALSDAQIVASGLAPTMIAALVFLGGCVLLVSGSLPAMPDRTAELVALLPLPFIEASHMAASLAGAALLLLSSGLYRRLDGAFWLTRMILLAGAAFSLAKGLDYEEAGVMLVIAGLLQWTRPAFYRRTSFTADALSAGWLATVAVAVAVSIWIGFFSYKHVAYSDDLWWHFARGGNASRFLRASFAVAVFLLGTAIWRMLRPAVVRPVAAMSAIPDPGALALSSRTDANLALTGDKRFITSASGDCFLMYQIRGHSWIVMSDPVGARQAWTDLLWQLREQADAAQGRLLLYQISAEALPAAVDLGLQIVKYGEEALVDLTTFSLDGPAAKSLRHAERRAMREGATFEIVPADGVPAILEDIHAISDRWLKAKGHREKGFSVGWFDPAYIGRFDCALVRQEGRIVAFANIWTTADKSELSIDLMRHDDQTPYGTMDFLFVRLMQWGKDNGYGRFSLGLAPLSGLEARRLAPLWSRLGSLLYKHGEAFYGFEGLRAYKDKFSPDWQPRFIAGPQGLALGRAMIDLQALISARRPDDRARSGKSGAVMPPDSV